jgi:capsular exopolysaccharide synthesis family protein
MIARIARQSKNRRTPAPRREAASPPQISAERERRLSATLLRLGKLNQEALDRIAAMQRQTNAPFAKTAAQLGLLTREDLETAIGVQNGYLREHEGEGRLPPEAVIIRRPASKETEQFRALRTRLLTSKDSEKLKLFAVTANRTSREADHVTINLAASLAQIGKRVIIVDADLRGRRLASRFGVANEPGLKETLDGACDIRQAIRPTIIANLNILTSGDPTTGGPELLIGETLRLTLDYLRCAYDAVIVMTTPFGEIADAQFVWSAAGSVFVVTRRHQDRGPEIKALDGAIRHVGADVFAAVLAG